MNTEGLPSSGNPSIIKLKISIIETFEKLVY